MTHYRVPFFVALREALRERSCELLLAHGDPTAEEATKGDAATLDWAVKLPTRYFLGGRLCWQPFAHLLPGVDAVVLTPENKLINNLPTQFRAHCKVLLWGHGANLQGDPSSWKERFKRWVGRHADWWLAYTAISLPLILKTGFPPERITVLNNSVDTQDLRELRAALDEETIRLTRERHGLKGRNVGVFVGSLYKDKRIDVLLEAAERVRRQVPDFELLVFGAGPLSNELERFCASHPWARWAGVAKGADKVAGIATAQVMLNPGLVGLGILDSFACGVPMVTTDCGLHSPEIAYLESGVNGVMTADDLDTYVQTVVDLLRDEAALQRLQQGCFASADRYSVRNMATNFADGVASCLQRPRSR